MVRNAKLPDVEVVKRHRDEGMSNIDIGNQYGTTGEAVRLALKRAGIEMPPMRINHAHYLPWRIRADHSHDVIARRLRAYSTLQQGGTLDESEQRKLERWMSFMDGANSYGLRLSVHYDRTDREGFWLAPREPGDRDYIHPPENPRTH